MNINQKGEKCAFNEQYYVNRINNFQSHFLFNFNKIFQFLIAMESFPDVCFTNKSATKQPH